MFSGIGGFELGIQRAMPSATCVGYSEIDKYAIQVYEKHFNHKNYGDATKIRTADLPSFDCLVGGFPCQAFSIAGKRRGFDDTRGTLFFEIARILKDKKPKCFVLENVKGLLSHDNGFTFKTIISTLDELGYDLQWQVLNSKNFGVPQNRERVFIIGHTRGTSRPEVFSIREGYQSDNNSTEELSMQYSNTLRTGYGTKWSNETFVAELKYVGGIVGERDLWLKDGKQNSRNFSQGQRVYSPSGIASTLAGNAGGLGGKTGLYVIGEDVRIRRLTPTECERLQGFPDGHTEGVSDTQRYKCLGNAVTVNVIEAIFARLAHS